MQTDGFRPVNPLGQVVARQLNRAAAQAAMSQRRYMVSGSMYEGVFGQILAPERDREAFCVITGATSVAHVFAGTFQFLDTSIADTQIGYVTLDECYVFPLPPTPDPNTGDYIMGRYAGEMTIGGITRSVIAYC